LTSVEADGTVVSMPRADIKDHTNELLLEFLDGFHES
jgi:hypothetical protein